MALSFVALPNSAIAQIPRDELPRDKIRTEILDAPKIVVDTTGYQNFISRYNNAFIISGGENEIHYWYVSDSDRRMARYVNQQYKNFATYKNPMYRHEWNHYKNNLFGARLHRTSATDAFLLNLFDEVSSYIYQDINFSKKLARKINKMSNSARDEYFDTIKPIIINEIVKQANILLDNHNYASQFILASKLLYDVSPNPANEPQYAHKTSDIILDMLQFYSDEFKINENSQLNSYKILTSTDIDEIIYKILQNPATKVLVGEIEKSAEQKIELNSLRKSAPSILSMERITGISEMKSLDLSDFYSIRELVAFNTTLPSLDSIKFPTLLQKLSISNIAADYSGVEKLDLSNLKFLKEITFHTHVLPKIIVLPADILDVFLFSTASDKTTIDATRVLDKFLVRRLQRQGFNVLVPKKYDRAIANITNLEKNKDKPIAIESYNRE